MLCVFQEEIISGFPPHTLFFCFIFKEITLRKQKTSNENDELPWDFKCYVLTQVQVTLDWSRRQLTYSKILLPGFPIGLLSAPAHALTLPLLRAGRVLALTWMEAGPSPTQTVSYTTCRMCVPALCNGVKNENLSGTELVHSRTYCYLFCSFATLTGINHVPLIAAMIKSTKTLHFLTFRTWSKLLREMACLA